jgi:hypothetical protein
MKILIVVVVTCLMGLVGCHRKAPEKVLRTTVDLTRGDDDFVLPEALWKTLETAYPDLTEIAPPTTAKEEKEEKKEEKKEKKEEAKEAKKDAKAGIVKADTEDDEMFKRRPTVDPLSFSIFLTEKTSGVLSEPSYELKFGHGGGSFDYKDYLPEDKNGTFFLKVKYGEEMDPKLKKVFYLSNAKSGSGCNKYFEITKYWKDAMKHDGLVLNTSGFRHIDFTAGTFFFVSPAKGKLRLGHLTIKDSRHPELLCVVNPRH